MCTSHITGDLSNASQSFMIEVNNPPIQNTHVQSREIGFQRQPGGSEGYRPILTESFMKVYQALIPALNDIVSYAHQTAVYFPAYRHEYFKPWIHPLCDFQLNF